MFSFLIFIYSILFSWLAWKNFQLAISLIIFALPSYIIRFSLIGLPFTLLEAMILIAVIIWTIQNYQNILAGCRLRFKKNIQFINYPFGLELILLVIIAFISAGISGFSNEALGAWKAYFFEPALFYILLINAFGPRSNKPKILWEYLIYPLALSAFIISAFTIYQKITGQFLPIAWINTGRITSIFDYPNALGLYLGPIILLLIKNYELKIKEHSLAIKIFINLTIILSLISIFLAFSVGAILGVVSALIFFSLILNQTTRKITLFFLIFGTLIGLFSPQVKNYLIKKSHLRDLSGAIRKEQWHETWEMLKDGRLISGAGLANYQKIITPYHQDGIFFNRDNDPDFRRKIVIFNEEYKKKYWQPTEIYLYPHNIFLNFWSEIGLFGLILTLWIIGKFFYLCFIFLKNKEERILILSLMSAMLVILIHGLVDVPYFKNDLSILFWIIIGCLGLIDIKKKQNGLKI